MGFVNLRSPVQIRELAKKTSSVVRRKATQGSRVGQPWPTPLQRIPLSKRSQQHSSGRPLRASGARSRGRRRGEQCGPAWACPPEAVEQRLAGGVGRFPGSGPTVGYTARS
jgi:hypothetical protein